jgi:nucleoside-diphosphate kinase
MDPVKATLGTIRGDYALDILYNVVHGSGSPESASGKSRSSFRSSLTLFRAGR